MIYDISKKEKQNFVTNKKLFKKSFNSNFRQQNLTIT